MFNNSRRFCVFQNKKSSFFFKVLTRSTTTTKSSRSSSVVSEVRKRSTGVLTGVTTGRQSRFKDRPSSCFPARSVESVGSGTPRKDLLGDSGVKGERGGLRVYRRPNSEVTVPRFESVLRCNDLKCLYKEEKELEGKSRLVLGEELYAGRTPEVL